MNSILTRKQIVWVVLFGLASALPDNSVGLILKLFIPKVPLVGGLFSSALVGALLYIGVFMAPRLGAGLIYMLVFMSIAVVTPSFGTPGLYKLLIALILGLYIDIVLFVGRYSRPAYIFCVATTVPLSLPVTYLIWSLLQVYGPTFSLKSSLSGWLNLFLILAYLGMGVLGALLGDFIVKSRLSAMEGVASIRGSV